MGSPLAWLVLWELFARAGVIQTIVLPAPSSVLVTAHHLLASGELQTNLVASLKRAVMGFSIGSSLGLLLGVLVGVFRLADALLDRSLQTIRAVPFLAIIPLVIVWFGVGESGKVFLIALGSLFPMYLNTVLGIRQVDPKLLEMGRTMGLGRAQLIAYALLPGALPSILNGVRLALTTSWLALVVAETVGASAGIGFLATNAREFLQTDVMVLVIVLYALIGMLSDLLARWLDLVLEAERLGFDLVLLAQHTMNPRDDTLDELEPWTASAALAALTQRIELIAAIKPLLYHPVVLAKLALQIEHISRGRFALNLVNAWNKGELERAGIEFPAHDARYAYGGEWIQIVEALLRGERVHHRGEHFAISDVVLRPAGTYRTRPPIYIGGESEAGRALAARHGDIWLINGRPLPELQPLLDDVRARERAAGQPPLRFGLSALVIARATEDEAHSHHEHLVRLASAPTHTSARARNVDPEVAMHKALNHLRHVGTNGGTAAGLVGSYDQIAERIQAFANAGIDTFLLQFQPFEAEMRRFAEQVLPCLR